MQNAREKRAEANRLRTLAVNSRTEAERNGYLRRASELEVAAERWEAAEERVDLMSTILCSDSFSYTFDDLDPLDTETLQRIANATAEEQAAKETPDLSWIRPMNEVLHPDDAA